jgi:hypothetical protein
MKNQIIQRILLLCLTFSVAFVSCKKDNADVIAQDPASYDKNDYPGVEGDNAIPDESETLDAINPFAAAAAVTTAGARRNLIFYSTNEASSALSPVYNVSFTQWASLQRYSTAYSVQRSTDFARFGNYSIRFELRKTDGDIGNSKRSEALRYTKSEPLTKCERWYGASTYLPTDYVTDPAAELVTQWHTDAGSPPLALWTQNGQWKVVIMGKITVLGNYEKNKWVDWVYHVKWSPTSDGLVEIWKDGVKVISKAGANIYSNAIGGAYFRVGIYKWPWKQGSNPASTTTKRVMYVDEARVGGELATYYDVAPGNY